MKGNDKLIGVLNNLLADELTAINQYMVHSEMCDNWGYARLHKAIERRAIDEMKHAERLIARILFLDGLPVVSKLKEVHIGKNIGEMIGNDLDAEAGAIRAYNEAIALAVAVADNASRVLLESILKDEEAHLDWGEAQRDQIQQMGAENYLTNQVDGE